MLKVAVSIGSLYMVSGFIAWSEVHDALKHAQYSVMVAALLVFWIGQFSSALRCMYIARVLRGGLDYTTSLRAHFIGLWFNQVMPTSLGGDVVKVAVLKRPLGLSVAIRSAILDRLFGLMFLLLAVVVTLPLYTNLFPSRTELIIALGVAAAGGWLTILLGTYVAYRIPGITKSDPVIIKLIQIFSDIYTFRKKSHLWEQLWTSAVVHLAGIFTYSLLGIALGVNVNILIFALAVPVVFIIALLPISFAGWGVREIGSVWIFGMIGISKEMSIAMSVSFGFLLCIAALPGLYVWVFTKK